MSSKRPLQCNVKRNFSYGTGFTLIELLVVIAVISLLMAILMPALNRARKQGQAAVCKSNLRQIGVAAHLYAENWNSFIPLGLKEFDPTNDIYPWFHLFMPYLGNKPKDEDYRSVKIYRCPSYPDKRQTVRYIINNFEFNDEGEIVIGGDHYGLDKPIKLLPYKRRETTIYLVDYEYLPGSNPLEGKLDDIDPGVIGMFDVWSEDHLPMADIITRRVARARHRKGCHCLYIDWHVDYVAAEDMTVDMWRFKK